jgi:hypothetical protein
VRNEGGETVAVISINEETVVARRSRQGAQRLGKFGRSVGCVQRAAGGRLDVGRRAGVARGAGRRAMGPGLLARGGCARLAAWRGRGERAGREEREERDSKSEEGERE